MDRLILLVESRIRGDVYVRFGGELPKTHRSNTAGRWMLSLPLRSVHNLVKSARRAQQTMLLVGDISDIYVSNFRSMLNDTNYSAEELAAMAAGYTKLLSASADLLNDLKQIITPSGLSMTDKERLDIIDRIYYEMLEYRNLTEYYTRKNISVSFLRSRQRGDSERVRALYGGHNDRYW